MIHQEDSLKTLKDTVDILTSCGITYWLDDGTLLGFLRENRFIPWDNDIDIGVLGTEAWSHWPQLFQAFTDQGYHAFIRFNKIEIEHKASRSAPLALQCYWVNRQSQLVYSGKLWNKPAFSPWLRFLDFVLLKIRQRIAILANPWHPLYRDTAWRNIEKKLWHSPAFLRWFGTLKLLNVLGTQYVMAVDAVLPCARYELPDGMTVAIPGHSQELLTLKYGADWQVPKQDFDKTSYGHQRS